MYYSGYTWILLCIGLYRKPHTSRSLLYTVGSINQSSVHDTFQKHTPIYKYICIYGRIRYAEHNHRQFTQLQKWNKERYKPEKDRKTRSREKNTNSRGKFSFTISRSRRFEVYIRSLKYSGEFYDYFPLIIEMDSDD